MRLPDVARHPAQHLLASASTLKEVPPVRYLVSGCVLLLGASTWLAAQQPAPRTLAKPDAQFDQPFDAVLSVRELADGRVLVTDLGPRTVLLADFKTNQQVTIGRNGQGPGEYQFPGDLLPYLGDTTLLVDRASRRFLTIAADGKLGNTVPFPDAIQGLGEPRGTDRQGRIYFQGSPFPGGLGVGDPGTIPDTVAVLRWDRVSGRVDTVARVKVQAIKMQVSGSQNSRAVMMRPQPFAPSDEWAVSSDGRVAIARVGDFHVDWLGEGAPLRGAPIEFERLKVVEGDREAFLSNMRNSRNRISITRGGPGRGAEMKPPEVTAADFEWPETKPPFPSRAALMAPEGVLWLVRTTSASDSTPTFDLFDRSGAGTGRVILPLGRRLVGIGKGTLYAVRTDGDGLQWLERYRR